MFDAGMYCHRACIVGLMPNRPLDVKMLFLLH
jgi:hypothetical protein